MEMLPPLKKISVGNAGRYQSGLLCTLLAHVSEDVGHDFR